MLNVCHSSLGSEEDVIANLIRFFFVALPIGRYSYRTISSYSFLSLFLSCAKERWSEKTCGNGDFLLLFSSFSPTLG